MDTFLKPFLPGLLAIMLGAAACTTIDVYEKTVSLKGHAWKKSEKPVFTFTISDTTSVYDLQLVLRHTDRYRFNNIWLNLTVNGPGMDSARTIRVERVLASDDQGWLASGMDDIFEHRISLNDKLLENQLSLSRKGEYTFTLEQIMREDPLAEVMNVGIRLDKKP